MSLGARSRPRLVVLGSGPLAGRRFDVRKGDQLIGRDPQARVVLDAPEISRRHARVSWDGATASIEDLGSRNGTTVNGRPADEPRGLRDGDVIGLGALEVAYEAPRAPTWSQRLDTTAKKVVAAAGGIAVIAAAAAGVMALLPPDDPEPADRATVDRLRLHPVALSDFKAHLRFIAAAPERPAVLVAGSTLVAAALQTTTTAPTQTEPPATATQSTATQPPPPANRTAACVEEPAPGRAACETSYKVPGADLKRTAPELTSAARRIGRRVTETYALPASCRVQPPAESCPLTTGIEPRIEPGARVSSSVRTQAAVLALIREQLRQLRNTKTTTNADGTKNPLGHELRYRVRVCGFGGRSVRVFWAIYDDHQPRRIPYAWLNNRLANVLERGSPGCVTRFMWFWVPLPARAGRYTVTLRVRDHGEDIAEPHESRAFTSTP